MQGKKSHKAGLRSGSIHYLQRKLPKNHQIPLRGTLANFFFCPFGAPNIFWCIFEQEPKIFETQIPNLMLRDDILRVDGWQYKEAERGCNSSARVNLDHGMLCLRKLLRAIEIDGIQNGELCVNCVVESSF